VREQLEHDRIIRLLPARYRRRFEVAINPGGEQNAAVGSGQKAVYPDAVLYGGEKGRKVLGIAEVETVESVNHLEAMAQWASLGRLKMTFHLYVPASTIDVARRMASTYQVALTELWSYDNVGDQVRFTLIQRSPEPAAPPNKAAQAPRRATHAAAPAPSRRRSPARPGRSAVARAVSARAKSARPVAKGSAKRKTKALPKNHKAASRKLQKRR